MDGRPLIEVLCSTKKVHDWVCEFFFFTLSPSSPYSFFFSVGLADRVEIDKVQTYVQKLIGRLGNGKMELIDFILRLVLLLVFADLKT